MDEMLLIDKPKDITSFGVVARVRRVLTQTMREEYERRGEQVPKRLKVGHTGTLDPFATGLLIILVGKATKRSGEFLKLDKEYVAEMELGKVSTTGDPEGEIELYEKKFRKFPLRSKNGENRGQGGCLGAPSREEVEEVLRAVSGEILQRVPAYSAVKIQGRRAYELARKGVEVEMPVRKVRIYEIELLEYEYPRMKFRAKVSSGTYIRALGEEIGEKLGTGAYLTELRRTRIGKYRVEEARDLAEFLGGR